MYLVQAAGNNIDYTTIDPKCTRKQQTAGGQAGFVMRRAGGRREAESSVAADTTFFGSVSAAGGCGRRRDRTFSEQHIGRGREGKVCDIQQVNVLGKYGRSFTRT